MSRTSPFSPGTWVARLDRAGRLGQCPQLGCVRHSYPDAGLADVVLYAHDGRLIGRESFPRGGPPGFEPRCPVAQWVAIEPPDFLLLPRFPSYGHLLRPVSDAGAAIPPVGIPPRPEWERRFASRLQSVLGLHADGLQAVVREELSNFPATDDAWTRLLPETAADGCASQLGAC